MTNSTAIRTVFTRLAPILTIPLARSKASRTALLSLLVLSASGCGDSSNITPPPLGPTPLPLPSTTVTLEGLVLDEQNQPVGGARITLAYIQGTGPTSGPSVTADNTGSFSLALDLPANWPQVHLDVERDGYESTSIGVRPDAATRAVLITTYRSLTISPGESIQTTVSLVSLPSFVCGAWDKHPCRRVRVNAPSGTLVDIEVFPADGQEYVGLAAGRYARYEDNLPRQVTVSGGDDVWIVVGKLGRVTLRAGGR
jgi:hypothetical protein